MSKASDEQAAAAKADVQVQPAELDGESLDLAVGGATLSTATVSSGLVLGGTTGRETSRKGTLVGNEETSKGSILPGTSKSNPG
jgi:hypothetical protein